MALYTSTTKLVYTNWLLNNTPSSWYGVVVESGHVVELRLGTYDMTGFIPPELGNLSKLRVLELGFDSLTGIIPPELGKLVTWSFYS